MTAVSIVAGTLLVVAVLQDVFATVLVPSSGRGVLRRPISRTAWRILRAGAMRCGPTGHQWVLGLSGPVIITMTLLAWPLLLIAGFTLIYLPGLGEGIRASTGPTDTSWTTAAYFSGFTLTTLGVGDIVAVAAPYRLLTVLQAGLGFGGITMAVTYFLSVYGSLVDRDAGARALHQRTTGTGDPAELVVAAAQDEDFTAARQQFSSVADHLRQLHESHSFYPVLHYFRRSDPEYALPRLLMLTLDAAALTRTTLDGDRYGPLQRARTLDELELASRTLLSRIAPDDDDAVRTITEDDRRRWRRRHDDAVALLRAAGVTVDPDPEGYVRLREGWEPALRAATEEMAYRWSDVDVHDDDTGQGADSDRS